MWSLVHRSPGDAFPVVFRGTTQGVYPLAWDACVSEGVVIDP
jgi:hypothetical protein